MDKQGFKRTSSDHCVFIKGFPNDQFIILLLYVDDMLIVGQDAQKITLLKKELGKSFAMKDLGQARQILGIKITRNRNNGKLWLSQHGYIERVLKRFNMDKAKPVGTPFSNHFKLSSEQCPANE